MALAALPASGSTAWYTWASNIHSAVALLQGKNVKEYGAKGDGTTDDTSAIQAALDALPTGGGGLYFPAGDYIVSAPIRVEKDGTRLTGDGAGARFGASQASTGTRIRAKSGISNSVLLCQRAANDRPLHGIHITDMSIDGNNLGATVKGVTFKVNQGTMNNVHVWQCTGVGIYVAGYASPYWDTYDTRFTKIIVGYCGVAGVELAGNAADTQWSDSSILYNYDNLIIGGSSQQFSNVHTYTASRYNIWFNGGGSRTKFSNCKIEGCYNHGTYIDSTVAGYSDIQFTGCGWSSLSQSTTNNTYDYVHVAGPSGNGISRLTISGCSFNMKGGSTIKARHAINFASSAMQGAVITGNSFGPASHWGTSPLNQGSSSSTLPYIRGNAGLPDVFYSVTQTANYTVSETDADGNTIEMDSATAVTVTIPPAATPGLQKGNVITVMQKGTGQVTFAPGAGVTLNTPSTLTTRARYSTVTLRMRATNSWVLSGDLT